MTARWYEHWRDEVFCLLPTDHPRGFLEIGIGRGDTACLLYRHGRATEYDVYVGIDTWAVETLRQRADVAGTVEAAEKNEKIARRQIKQTWNYYASIHKGPSEWVLKWMLYAYAPWRADLIFIDGMHTVEGVLLDSRLSWRLLADDGIMIWDDWGKLKRDHVAVKKAVATFTAEIDGQYTELFRTRQYGIRKNGRDKADAQLGQAEAAELG